MLLTSCDFSLSLVTHTIYSKMHLSTTASLAMSNRMFESDDHVLHTTEPLQFVCVIADLVPIRPFLQFSS